MTNTKTDPTTTTATATSTSISTVFTIEPYDNTEFRWDR